MNTQVESFLQKLKEEKAEIISIDYIPKEGFKVFTSKGSYTKANLPLIAKFTEEDFLEVEEKARLNIFSNLTQEVIETASETKYEIENSISEFIQKIANIKTSSNNEEENAKEILDIIGQIQEPEIKKILFKKFQTKQTNQNFEKLLKISYVDNLLTCFNSTYYHHYFGTNDIMWNRDDDIKEYNILLEMLYKHETNAVMFIDMNNFKIINDNVSHDAGDIVLQKLGCELVQEYKDLLSIRRSGDEFIVFGKRERLEELSNSITNQHFAQHLSSHLPDIKLHGMQVQATVSYGIQNVLIPKCVENTIEIMHFKTMLNKSIVVAESKMYDYKKSFKEEEIKNRPKVERIEESISKAVTKQQDTSLDTKA